MSPRQKAIVLLSGGLDSAVSLAWAVREYNVIRAVFVEYGHKASPMEASAVTAVARRCKVEASRTKLPFFAQLCRSYEAVTTRATTDSSEQPSEAIDELRRVWAPNRNMVFVSIAAAFAEALDCEVVVAGFNAEDAEQFPDNSAEFAARMNHALELSTLSSVRLVCPLIGLRKAEILKM